MTMFISGRPQYSQSQGCVECGNRYVHDKIAAMTHAVGCTVANRHPWASWLPRICHALNTEVHTATQESPFRMMFGEDSRSDFVLDGFMLEFLQRKTWKITKVKTSMDMMHRVILTWIEER